MEAANKVCLKRRQLRDVAERGRTVESVVAQFNQTVEPMAALHVLPTAKYADLVLSGEQPRLQLVDTVLEHVHGRSADGMMTRQSGDAMRATYRDRDEKEPSEARA
jgi:uridine kinase